MKKLSKWTFQLIVWIIVCTVVSWIVNKLGGSLWFQGGISAIIAVRIDDFIKKSLK